MLGVGDYNPSWIFPILFQYFALNNSKSYLSIKVYLFQICWHHFYKVLTHVVLKAPNLEISNLSIFRSTQKIHIYLFFEKYWVSRLKIWALASAKPRQLEAMMPQKIPHLEVWTACHRPEYWSYRTLDWLNLSVIVLVSSLSHPETQIIERKLIFQFS